MDIIQQATSLQASGASTKDWIGRIEGGVIYAYDIGTLVSQGAESIGLVKEDLEQTLKHDSRKSNLPMGEHIREAIQIIKGCAD